MADNDESKAPHPLFQKVPTRAVGIGLLTLGLFVLFKPNDLPWLEETQKRSISDALLVAGLLTVFVGPFIKGRLYNEVSAGTFHFLLGFAQPREIQDALRKLAFETKIYARDLRVDCCIERADERNVRIRIRSTVRIENPTSEIAEHEPSLAFEEMERPTVENITVKLRMRLDIFLAT